MTQKTRTALALAGEIRKGKCSVRETVQETLKKIYAAGHEIANHGFFHKDQKKLDYARNFAIGRITRDMDAFSFNTAVARLMELLNAVTKYDALAVKNTKLLKETMRDFLLLLAPCAPHFCEELWEKTGGKGFIFEQRYPVENKDALTLDETEYAVQVNSRIVCKAMIASDLSDAEVQEFVCALPEVKEKLAGRPVKKCIVVKGRLVNLIG